MARLCVGLQTRRAFLVCLFNGKYIIGIDMKKQTRSILQELSSIAPNKDTHHLIEATANNIINSSINLFELIYRTYDEQTANELERKFFNSIRASDPRKFKRGIQRINEAQQQEDK